MCTHHFFAATRTHQTHHNRIPAFLSTIALTASFVSGLWCQSIKFQAADDGPNPTLRFGAWYRQTTELVELGTIVDGDTKYYVTRSSCEPLDDYGDVDAKWKATRAFTVLAPLLGAFLTFGLYLNACFYRANAATFRYTAIIMYMILLTTFQGLTFLLLDSNLCHDNPILSEEESAAAAAAAATEIYPNDCEWDDGMTANVVSTVAWFLTGAVMLYQGAPQRPPRPPPETQAVTYEKTTGPDGTTTVIAETTVVKGVAVQEEEETNEKVLAAGGS